MSDKTTSKPSFKEILNSKKLNKMKDSFQYLVFVACADDGKLEANAATAENFEVMKTKTIKKAAMKLVKKGLFNVNDGVFTLSEKGMRQITRKKIKS